jgi:predicted permease
MVSEESGMRWAFAWMESFLIDLRHATRSFKRTPIFAATVIGTIGLALGLNTTLFTVFNAYVLQPFAVRDPFSLYDIAWNTKSGGRDLTWQEFEDLQRRNPVLSEVMADGETIQIPSQGLMGRAVSGNYFTALGAGAMLGRTLLPEDSAGAYGSPVLVLSYQSWQRRFGADPNVLGRSILIRGNSYEIVGVSRPGFMGVETGANGFYIPLTASNSLNFHKVVGRLKEGITPQQAHAALSVWARQHTAELPEAEKATDALLESSATPFALDRDTLIFFAPIFVSFGLVLLIACTNVANMMLARAIARQREIGVRLALGAARLRLVRQLLTEGLLLALPAAALGFGVSEAALYLIQRLVFATLPPLMGPMMMSQFRTLPPNFAVFTFILIAAVVAALAFGLAPALQATRPDLVLTTRGEFGNDFRPGRLRRVLVVGQVTVCLLLLVCSGVLLRATKKVEDLDIGLVTRGAFNIEIDPKYQSKVVDRLRSDRKLESIAIVWQPPLYGRDQTLLPVAFGPSGDVTWSRYNFVSPEYFDVFRIPLLGGRNFTVEESKAGAAVVIVSHATARHLWPGENAIGKSIRLMEDPTLRGRAPAFHTAEVIGIARDVTSGTVSEGLDTTCLYFPTSLQSAGNGSLLVRFKEGGNVTPRSVMAALEQAAPDAHLIHPMDEVLAIETYMYRIGAWVSSFLGALALVLTLSGIYGVMAYLVSQRRKEIGIRMALGATPFSVIRTVLANSMKMASAGIAAGLLLALGLARIFASRITAIRMFDSVAFLGAIAVVASAAFAASCVPSWRAARVNPASTLRSE